MGMRLGICLLTCTHDVGLSHIATADSGKVKVVKAEGLLRLYTYVYTCRAYSNEIVQGHKHEYQSISWDWGWNNAWLPGIYSPYNHPNPRGGGGVALGKLCNSILKCNMYYIRISPCCYYSTHGVVYTVNKVAYGEHHFTTSCAIWNRTETSCQ